MQRVLCMWEEKSWSIEPKEINSSLETLNQKKPIVVLKHWTKGEKESLFLSLFLSLMWLKSNSIFFSKSALYGRTSWSPTWGLCFYIYIYIDWWLVFAWRNRKVEAEALLKVAIQGQMEHFLLKKKTKHFCIMSLYDSFLIP